MSTVSEAYLLGIKEGRSFLKTWERVNGEKPSPETIAGIISNIKATIKGQSEEVRETLRGELDFWKRRLKQ